MRKLKENRKKGFTLVELIVVLVILAILAALLVPALTGYIDKAKEKQIIAETRQAVMAAQTLIDEEYAKGTAIADIPTAVTDTKIEKLADVKGDVTALTAADIDSQGHLLQLVYKQNGTGGKTCTYKREPAADEEQYTVN